MNLEYNLNLTQEQKLIMTQEMQLSVKILQMTAFELREFIDKEIEENPVLEDTDETTDSESKEKPDFAEFVKQFEYSSPGQKEYSQDSEEVSPFNFISESKSLKEYLFEQVSELDEPDICKSICNYIIENLDYKGYLDVATDAIAEELNIENKAVEYALKVVQSLDPAGIAARDLKECLKIQLERKGLKNINLYKIVDEYLELLAENKFNTIARKLKIDVAEAQRYGDIIKSLQPKPSSGFYTGEQVRYIIPDAYIRKIDDKYYIIMNEEIGPKLKISSLYQKILKNDSDKETVEYIKEKINNAVFLIKSIEHRKTTIYRVLEKIVEIQRGFFDSGKEYLKPMTLKEIADLLDIHESTVSRAIRDKYILTDHGTIKIKDLFTAGISSDKSGIGISVNIIKTEITKLIDEENKKSPLSDQHISDILNRKGISISRRTVAKYREEMGIKNSKGRKRF